MFISLIGGVSVFGLLGLVLGPLIVAMVIALSDAYAEPPDTIARADERPATRV
jgi:predicted PurR-regulated permease PerM